MRISAKGEYAIRALLDLAVHHGEGLASDLAPLWREIAGAVATVIDRTTFGDLAEQVKARRSPERSIYHI